MVVDDYVPLDEDSRLLLPVSSMRGELWPVIVAKALCKVLAYSFHASGDEFEFGDACILQALTGWLPEMHSLSLNGYVDPKTAYGMCATTYFSLLPCLLMH